MAIVDQFLEDYIQRFLEGNQAGRLVRDTLGQLGLGLMPLIDHCTLRTNDVEEWAGRLHDLGYRWDETLGVLEFDDWWAKVYRQPGYPAMFVDQAFAGPRGESSLIPNWVAVHGDRCFHHIAIRVECVDDAVSAFRNQGIPFASEVIGAPGGDLRQIFTQPEIRDGCSYSVLELVERHRGYEGFLPPQANGLMESSRG